MRPILHTAVLLALTAAPSARAQKPKSDDDFAKARPTLGETIPDVTVYDSAGKEVKTSSLRGHYTVLTFGCLT
jgi:cytochrome oxidase Cu insertion factor (SCO1/SenC/PrrC family)